MVISANRVVVQHSSRTKGWYVLYEYVALIECLHSVQVPLDIMHNVILALKFLVFILDSEVLNLKEPSDNISSPVLLELLRTNTGRDSVSGLLALVCPLISRVPVSMALAANSLNAASQDRC